MKDFEIVITGIGAGLFSLAMIIAAIGYTRDFSLWFFQIIERYL